MELGTLLDILGAVAILSGAALALLASIGLVRFRSVYLRMHAATKTQTLGLLLILVGLALTVRTWNAVGTLLLVAIAQSLTAPVSAHMLSRAAYREGLVRSAQFTRDELADALDQAKREEAEREQAERDQAAREQAADAQARGDEAKDEPAGGAQADREQTARE